MKNKQTVLLGISIGIGLAVVLLFVFFTGFYIGSKKAGVFPFWERRFVTPSGFVPSRFGHGVAGTIDSIGENTIIVKERSGALKTVLVDEETVLRKNGSSINFSDLKKDEQVIIIGEPQEKEGAIKAKVIRVIWIKLFNSSKKF
ncbi:hypothetical protein HY946_00850 [Candidatus Gottesmanbacteria bacterium]|nr:hypothetical protein [Candidatus Gottesmanbacteria bacterium]